MSEPLEVIGQARRRIARLAALRSALYLLPPALAALVLGLTFDGIGPETWGRWGYVLEPRLGADIRVGLFAGAATVCALGGLLAMLAYRRAGDFVAAAERIDGRVDAKQQILTLATLADPARPAADSARSPLFPLLRRRALDYLDKFDPVREFHLELGAPLAGSSALTLALVVALGLSMLALVRPPRPLELRARAIRAIAHELSGPGSGAEARELANRLRAAAAALDNPELPPEKKLEQLTSLERELEQIKNPAEPQRKGEQSGSEKGKSGKGEGHGTGKSGKGGGQGKNQDRGGESAGKGEGAGGKGRGEAQMMELRNELTKSKAELQEESKTAEKSTPSSAQENKPGQEPRPGANPKQPPPAPPLETKGKAPTDRPKPELAHGSEQAKGGPQNKSEPQRKDLGSTAGDTRLGQFPEPARFERFYKAGEHGPPIEIKDARYVLFRVPPAVRTSGAGKTVLDTGRPTASTPYANLPLSESRLKAAPAEERQLVPPRYRDLLQ